MNRSGAYSAIPYPVADHRANTSAVSTAVIAHRLNRRGEWGSPCPGISGAAAAERTGPTP
ncbi:hypothetical protein ACX80E_14705 [Arthrobacter sp. TMN-49]